jgi:hypothetical protein
MVLREWYYGLYQSLPDYAKENMLSRQMLACSVLCRLMLDGDFLFEVDDPHHPTQPYDLVPNLNLSKIWHSTIIFHKVEGAGSSASSPPKKIQRQEWPSPGHLSSTSFLEQQESLRNFTLRFCLQVMLQVVGLDSLAQSVTCSVKLVLNKIMALSNLFILSFPFVPMKADRVALRRILTRLANRRRNGRAILLWVPLVLGYKKLCLGSGYWAVSASSRFTRSCVTDRLDC